MVTYVIEIEFEQRKLNTIVNYYRHIKSLSLNLHKSFSNTPTTSIEGSCQELLITGSFDEFNLAEFALLLEYFKRGSPAIVNISYLLYSDYPEANAAISNLFKPG